mmetsp:Transcript_1070/g.2669  ORF Transcript_1070/g.2669 Transcript_1070/m.2669 type:complete len:226 (-) Transcript_1070:615-1292(-)
MGRVEVLTCHCIQEVCQKLLWMGNEGADPQTTHVHHLVGRLEMQGKICEIKAAEPKEGGGGKGRSVRDLKRDVSNNKSHHQQQAQQQAQMPMFAFPDPNQATTAATTTMTMQPPPPPPHPYPGWGIPMYYPPPYPMVAAAVGGIVDYNHPDGTAPLPPPLPPMPPMMQPPPMPPMPPAMEYPVYDHHAAGMIPQPYASVMHPAPPGPYAMPDDDAKQHPQQADTH